MNTAQEEAQSNPDNTFALLFLTGRSIGQRLPIQPGSEVIIGRGKAAHVVVDDDKASRRHSRVFFENETLMAEDLGSANGTVVNGKRITKVALADGDHIRIGNSVFKIAVDPAVSTGAREWWEKTQRHTGRKTTRSAAKLIAGSLESVGLVDLLQLLSTSQKTGVLAIESGESVGKIHLKDGQIQHASIDGHTANQPEKTVYRLLRWKDGDFEFGPEEEIANTVGITESTQSLLLDGVQQADELQEIAGSLPDLKSSLRLARPLPERLSSLPPHELEIIQLAYEHGSVLSVLDHFEGTDADGYRLLNELIQRRLIEVIDAKSAGK